MRWQGAVTLASYHPRSQPLQACQDEIVVSVNIYGEEIGFQGQMVCLEDILQHAISLIAYVSVDAIAVVPRCILDQLTVSLLISLDQDRLPAILPQVRRVREEQAIPGSEFDTYPGGDADSLEYPGDDPILSMLRENPRGIVRELFHPPATFRLLWFRRQGCW